MLRDFSRGSRHTERNATLNFSAVKSNSEAVLKVEMGMGNNLFT